MASSLGLAEPRGMFRRRCRVEPKWEDVGGCDRTLMGDVVWGREAQDGVWGLAHARP